MNNLVTPASHTWHLVIEVSVKQTPAWNCKCSRVILARNDCLWRMKGRGSRSMCVEGAGQVLGPQHRSDTAEARQGNQEDWLKAALRTSWPGHRRTPEPRLPVRRLAQPWIPHHVCSLAGAPQWEWRPCEHGVDPKGTAAPSCQLRSLPTALCLCKEGLRGALPWLVQSFTFFQWHFPNHILVLSSLKCSEVLTAVLVAFVHSYWVPNLSIPRS